MRLEFPNVTGSTEVYMDVLRAICGETAGKSMSDLGCNLAPHTPLLGFEHRKYIDILPRTLDHPEEQQHFVNENLFEYLNRLVFYSGGHDVLDVTIATDLIEHVKKDQGYELMRLMELVSKKQILFTPLGYYMVDTLSNNPEAHQSGWYPEDVEKYGYATIVFPSYHPTLGDNGIGAFFSYKCDNLEQDFQRVHNHLLTTKSWAALSNHNLTP